MKRVFLGSLALAAIVTGCVTDPTSELSGSPVAISTSISSVTLAVGDSVVIIAETKDGQGVAIPELPEPASADAAVATLSDAYLPPLAQARFYVKGVAAGTTEITLSVPSTSGVTATIDVTVN
jgi:hypothetical protein